ncbi:MAG: quinone-dependent dihydroorotate dehydrogenase [Bacteroidia bacterium]|nr:quinone-dependent dihydroorotate dehydrogenase [Bacteroidia bacterium]
MYKLIFRKIFFLFQPESIHNFVVFILKLINLLPGFRIVLNIFYRVRDPRLEKNVFSLRFKNPVGIAAGFDKDAEVSDSLEAFGFGFIEIGTVTPKAQPGNEKPRLFRLRKDQALINRMGFNNKGMRNAAGNLSKRKSNVIIGGNIGKNKLTSIENAMDDYLQCFMALYPYVDYFAVNVSSPNTPGLRNLQEKEPLRELLHAIMTVNKSMDKIRPVLLKIAPDLTNEQLDDIISIVKETGIHGIIATNTTISRDYLNYDEARVESFGSGGLSGKPLCEMSTKVIRYIIEKSGNTIPVIASGGIFNAIDAREKLNAGASLVQVYTGFIYEGPSIARKINKGLLRELDSVKEQSKN